MITKLYATFDKLAKAYNERFFQAPNNEVAIRIIQNSQKQDRFLNENAKDYSVWCLGTYDNETGEITPKKEMIYQLVEIKRESEQQVNENE